MRLLRRSRISLGGWWRLFAVVIAAPALLLSWLGLRAVGADRIERAQRLRDQQSQLANIADASLLNALTGLETELQGYDAGRAGSADAPLAAVQLVTFHRSGLVTFPRDRVYFGRFGQAPAERANTIWPEHLVALIEAAQALEARGHGGKAAELYARLARAEPRLGPWADIARGRLEWRAGSSEALGRLANVEWSRSAGLTPSGLPAAFVACATSEGGHASERAAFAPLIEQTIVSLREGRWWLSAEERTFYDTQLRQWLASAGGRSSDAGDPRLAELAAIDQALRLSPPSRRNGSTRTAEQARETTLLLLWVPSDRDGDLWTGAVVPGGDIARVFDPALNGLLPEQPFDITIRNALGSTLWSRGAGLTVPQHVAPLRAVAGWDIAFGSPRPLPVLERRELLWYAFIAVPLIVLLAGVGMTGAIIRREMALARMQSDFVSAVTHEFKSPITSVRLLLERLAAGRLPSPEAAGHYYAAMAQETERLERLVNRVLDAQQIDTGHRRYDLAPSHIEEIAADVIRHAQPVADAKRIAVDLHVNPPIPLVDVDRAVIADAIDNLLDNAIKYSPAGTTVAVRLHASDDRVTVEVEDHGIGIDDDEIPRVFEKFYRARRGDLQNVRGTGLGLSLVKAAVEAHGGSVDVSSEPGAGSRFSLHLPTRLASAGI